MKLFDNQVKSRFVSCPFNEWPIFECSLYLDMCLILSPVSVRDLEHCLADRTCQHSLHVRLHVQLQTLNFVRLKNVNKECKQRMKTKNGKTKQITWPRRHGPVVRTRLLRNFKHVASFSFFTLFNICHSLLNTFDHLL